MVGVGEEDLKQKEKAQLNFTAEHDKEKTGFSGSSALLQTFNITRVGGGGALT